MAVGLGLLGRGGTRRVVALWALHVAGAALAGAAAGGLVGWVGSLATLPAWRPWTVGAVALVALGLGVWRGAPPLGRQRQVPRRWARTMPPARRFFLWGALLGCGVATPIFHSAFLLLLGAQLTAGATLGAAAGALFGAARQATALLPVLGRAGPERTMDLLEVLRPLAGRLNAALVVAGGLILVLTSWR